MRAAVPLVAGAAALAVGYGQLWSRPDDLALACAVLATTFLMVHYTALAAGAGSSSSSWSSGGDDGGGGGDAERARGNYRRLALAMALVLYGLACAEVWDSAASREVAVAALASWCGAAALLLVYLVVSSAGRHCAVGCDYDAVP